MKNNLLILSQEFLLFVVLHARTLFLKLKGTTYQKSYPVIPLENYVRDHRKEALADARLLLRANERKIDRWLQARVDQQMRVANAARHEEFSVSLKAKAAVMEVAMSMTELAIWSRRNNK